MAQPREDGISQFHSHNDYERKRPLWDALEAGVRSVEADVWSFWNGLFVSHFPVFGKSGPFMSWYLGPLLRFPEQSPSLTWDYLWIDIKGPEGRVKEALLEQLKSSFSKQKFGAKTPKIIFSGRGPVKRALASEVSKWEDGQGNRFSHDEHELKIEDPPSAGEADPWRWYSLSWAERFQWNGRGCISKSEWAQWRSQVQLAHQKGRKIRYFHTPQTPDWIQASAHLGVDLIDLDDLTLAVNPRLNIHSQKKPATCDD